MRKTLSITLDDEAKTITVDNYMDFSVIEILGISEWLRIGAEDGVIKAERSAELKPPSKKRGRGRGRGVKLGLTGDRV